MKENYIAAFVTGIVVIIIGYLFYQFCLHPFLVCLLIALLFLIVFLAVGIIFLYLGIKQLLFGKKKE